MRSTRRRAGVRPTASARAAEPGRRSASTRPDWCARGATGCLPSRGRIRGYVCSKPARHPTRGTALLATGDPWLGGAALLTGAPDNARAALLATTTLDLRRLLLPPPITHDAAAQALPSVETAAADHGGLVPPA